MARALIIGLGISGRSAASLLLKRGYEVFAFDQKEQELKKNEEVQALLQKGLLFLQNAEALSAIDFAILSPGIPLRESFVEKVQAKGIEIIGEVEFALRELKNYIVAVTGSNGKTTTTLLIEHILKSSGRKAKALGNVGATVTGYLSQIDPEEILVLELSSFQLETLQRKAIDAACILNITPNHLDWHLSMENYVKAKASIQRAMKPGGKLFLSKEVQREFSDYFTSFEIYDSEDQNQIALKKKLSYTQRGRPEKNVEAAYSICRFLGVSDEEFLQGLSSFRKPPHRIEWVAEIDSVAYYNDSKSTSVASVLYAVENLKGPLILLVGGVHKGASYFPWIEGFQGKVKKIIAFGEASQIMEKELKEKIPLSRVSTLEEALFLARGEAKKLDTIILSPGCSSYDQFRSYEHRGEEFKRIVHSFRREKKE